MPDSKITALTSTGTGTDPAVDPLVIVDVSDTTMAATGTTKKVTLNQLLACSPTATLASATITGALTIGGATSFPASVINTSGGNPVFTPTASTLFLYSGSSFLSIRNQANTQEIFNLTPAGVYTFGDGAGGTRMTLNSTGLGVGGSPLYSIQSYGTAPAIATGGTTTMSAAGQIGASFVLRSESTSAWTGTREMVSFDSIGNGADHRIGGLSIKLKATSGASSLTEYLQINPAYGYTILQQGNLGIGVAPSAWASTYRALQIGIGTSLTGVTNDVDVNLVNNARFDGTNWKYTNTSPAERYRTAAATHFWYNAASGTAGNNITWTQAMTLDASGNLLVGVTSNPNTARAYFRYDTLTTQPVINSASIVAASTAWSHFIGQSGNGSSITTSNIFIYGNGNIQNINGVYGTISDLRLKENIADARNYLADLLKLRVVKYSLKEEASAVANKLGFIAQEVEQVFPAMVDTDPNDGNKGIKTSVLIPMLVKAIQELTARVQTLETR